jgi:hypothetical protein
MHPIAKLASTCIKSLPWTERNYYYFFSIYYDYLQMQVIYNYICLSLEYLFIPFLLECLLKLPFTLGYLLAGHL